MSTVLAIKIILALTSVVCFALAWKVLGNASTLEPKAQIKPRKML